MNDKRYRLILYVIVFVILGTISIQVYWNYKNYLTNKQQLVNDVQTSLDNSVEKYYTSLAEQNTIGFSFKATTDTVGIATNDQIDSIIRKFNISRYDFNNLDSLELEDIGGIKVIKGVKADSIFDQLSHTHNKEFFEDKKYKFSFNGKLHDSLLADSFKDLTSKVIISLANDSIKLQEIDSFFKIEKSNKKLNFEHELHLYTNMTGLDSVYNTIVSNAELYTTSKSALLPRPNKLIATFSNTTKEILKRSFSGILISTLLILVVISCLFYLLNIIKHQKQLAEVKNDLISNITHEFKTPIATISVALESIKDFDGINDKEKTKNYLDMSSNQLTKLNIMVEKLLETATLDSEKLDLKREDVNLIDLFYALVDKYTMTINGKTLKFDSSKTTINASIDIFHFENAISNIIDNAIKYGGDNITIDITESKKGIEIDITDDGTILTKAQANRIFEKFYRVPKGNTHDIKGFGIGLYYTKKIIEKHGGSIQVNLNNSNTNFKILLPNAGTN